MSTRIAGMLSKVGKQRPQLGSNEKVALVGLLTALVTLAFTVYLQFALRQASDVRIPVSVNAGQLQVGILESVVENASWVAFEDPESPARRQEAFSNRIRPALDILIPIATMLGDQEITEKLNTYGTQLRQLERTQWLIERLVVEPGDLPARGLYESDLRPVLQHVEWGLGVVVRRAPKALGQRGLNTVSDQLGALVAFERALVSFLDRRDEEARFFLEQSQDALKTAQARMYGTIYQLKEGDLKESLSFLSKEVSVLTKFAQPLLDKGSPLLERRSSRLAREDLMPVAKRLREQAAQGTQEQTKTSIRSIRGLRRFGAVVVVLALIMGLASATSLVTSIRLSRQMDEVLKRAQKLGQYRIEERLGGGAMGDVYKARHALLRRPTAIKVLKPSNQWDHSSQERFQREVQATSLLTHPNTVQVYDYGRTPDGLFYYAMELLEGVDLQRLVDRTGPMPPPRVVWLLRQACGSLAEAHEGGLLHRDIKLSNLMVTRRGLQYDVLKVVDFGLVRDHEKYGDGELVGTPGYMAPEVILEKRFNPRTEVYALGVAAYEMLTGVPPFSSAELDVLLRMHLETEAPLPSVALGRALPESLEAVISACLEKDANLRPDSVETLAELLLSVDVPPWSERQARAWWIDHEELLFTHYESDEAEKLSLRLERRTLI